MLTYVTELMKATLLQVWHTFVNNWLLLVISALVAALLRVYLDQEKIARFLQRYQSAGVLTATAAAVGTPLCSCGTTAVILGMLATRMPWSPIVAFMVASPLTSPQELFYSAGLFGWPFALAFFATSILLGLLAGMVTHVTENWGWLENQARFKPIMGAAEKTPEAAPVIQSSNQLQGMKRHSLVKEFILIGRRLFVFFFAFAFIGYALNNIMPATLMDTLFGSGNTYSVPLAATLGIPLYVNTEVSLPLVRAFLDAGMSPGAALAFMITGAGTSIGAFIGALTIARWRVVGLVVGTLWLGAMVFGFLYNLLGAVG